MIAFLQHEGKTLILELSPLPGKPGCFDAKVAHAFAPKIVAAPKKRTPKVKARQDTMDRAKILRDWCKENPGAHPVQTTGRRVLGVKSPGSIIAAVKEAVRQKWIRYDLKSSPHSIEAV